MRDLQNVSIKIKKMLKNDEITIKIYDDDDDDGYLFRCSRSY